MLMIMALNSGHLRRLAKAILCEPILGASFQISA